MPTDTDLQAQLADCKVLWGPYVRRIRNKVKREYARQYGVFRFAYGEAHCPEPPDTLSMGAQAVRLAAEAIYRHVVTEREPICHRCERLGCDCSCSESSTWGADFTL